VRRVIQPLVVVIGGSVAGVAAFLVVGPGIEPAASSPPVTVATTSTTMVSQPTPAPTSTSAVATVDPRGWLTIQGAGDTNFDPSYIPEFVANGYGYAFGGLGGLLLQDDLTVVNLECATSELGTPLDKEFTFRCDPAALPVARRFGVDVANLANNHVGDFGMEAMIDSRARVEAAGVAAVGVGSDLAEATSPAVFDIGGWKVAVVGMGGIVPAQGWLAGPSRPGMASGDDIDQMIASVRAAAEVADLVVVTIHWGTEGRSEPDPDDRRRAEALVAAGADVIFGHHPHRLGALEYVDGAPVFWTLGNFVWPRLSDASATTAVARVVVSPEGDVSACLIPVFIETSGRPVVQEPPPCSVPR